MATAYIVRYGRSGYLGRLRNAAQTSLDRGARVVLHGPRGLEVGTVLCEPDDRLNQFPQHDGELLRQTTHDDDAASDLQDQLAREILAAAQLRVDDLALPLACVDVEVLFDGQSAVLHALHWAECNADVLCEDLSAQFGLAVRLLDLSQVPLVPSEPEPATGCGKPNCGTSSGGCSSCGTGGGCSTGSCSKGSVKSAAQLTSYFADLRQKMEALAPSRTPLV